MLRLTGGEFNGRVIQAPAGQKTRPTQAKLRQALFNSLQMIVPGAKVLDLYAGSGSLGFEALSRGAESAVFVEHSASVGKVIQKNIEILKVRDRADLVLETVDRCWDRISRHAPFDLVLADPPYAGRWAEPLMQLPWNLLLSPDGYFCLESGESLDESFAIPFLVKVREKNYGDSVLTTFHRAALDDSTSGAERSET